MDVNAKYDQALPEGWALLTNVFEFIPGMLVREKNLDGYWKGSKEFLHLDHHSLSTQIDWGLGYQALTYDMMSGPTAWWDMKKFANQYTILVNIDKIQWKHAWLFEQWCYLNFNFDMAQHRTIHHPQHKDHGRAV